MSHTVEATGSEPTFLRLPLEVRNRIYKELLSTKVTKTQKLGLDNCRSPTRYDWNLHLQILSTNHQIHDETRDMFGRENNFVVIHCAAKELEQKKTDMGAEDTTIMKYRVRLWPGKRCEAVDVPNERMRIWLGKGSPTSSKTKVKPWLHVVLEEELRDVLAGLSIFQGRSGPYRMSGLSAVITLTPPTITETQKQTKTREARLLNPVLKLRFLDSAKIEGATPGKTQHVSEQLCRQKWDDQLVYSTFEELMSAGDQARDIGHHWVATGYYSRASDYILHFMDRHRYVFTSPLDPIAFMFKINLQRSRNWIECDNFYDALGAVESALTSANTIFRQNMTAVGPPPISANGEIKKGAFRKWTCECIKDGAATFGQRIKCEDVGFGYYYKSIAEHVLGGNEATEEAEDDKMIGIGCCVVSETSSEGCVKELLDLDKRVMSRLIEEGGGSSDEWEDESGDEE